jgi:ribosomal protein S6--L-glutamate ligase
MLNGFEQTQAVHNKARILARLARAGLPLPAGLLVGRRDRLAEELARGPRFVKPLQGSHGAGARRLERGEECLAGEGPWLVQEVAGSGDPTVLKVYGVRGVAAVRRMTFRPGVVDGDRRAVGSDPLLLRLARQAAAEAELVCWGVDFVVSADGPVVVDANAFPGYRSVAEAPDWLARTIEDELR